MDIEKIKRNLQFAIPQELYNIEPGQIAYFVPRDGMSQRSSIMLMDFFRYFRKLYKENNVKLNIVPTDNELLIDTFAGRSPQENGIPYKVVVSTWDTLAGFASQYFGEKIENIVERVPDMRLALMHIKISATNLPFVVTIYPLNKTVKGSAEIDEDSSEDFGMQLLTKRPETQKQKEDLTKKREDKLRKLLWDCAYLGIDLDVKGIADDVEAIKSQPTDGYQLSLKMEPAKAGLIDCHIFVGEGKELKLKPVWKAVYLTFLSLEKGIGIETATPAFTKRIQKIYKSLPDTSQKDPDNSGILHVDYVQPKTLRGYMSHINDEIAKHIPNGIVMLEFAIEGEKDDAFKVLRSTPEIREQIATTFNL
jgi:hypothetical protein